MPGKDCEAIPFQSPRLPPRPACYHGSTLSKLCPLWQPDTQARLPWGPVSPPPWRQAGSLGGAGP